MTPQGKKVNLNSLNSNQMGVIVTEEQTLQLLLTLLNALATLNRKLALDFHWNLSNPRLNRTHCKALMLLHFEQGCSMTHCSERLNLEKGSVTSVIHFLIRSGYVRREPDPRDRRRVLLVLTPEGEELFKQLKEQIAGHLSHKLRALPPEDAKALAQAVDTLSRISEKL